MDKASRSDRSKTASPVEFVKSPMRSVSLSVSLTVSLEYQKAPAASGMRSNPATKGLVFTKDLSGANELDARVCVNVNCSFWRNGDFRRNDVFRQVTLAGRHVAREREIWQRGQGNVVRTPDAGFEHAAAPYGNAILLAKIVNAPRHREAAHAP